MTSTFAEPTPSPRTAPARTSRGRAAALVGVLLLLVVAVFAQVHQFSFLRWDDSIMVTENPHLRAGDWRGVAAFWREPYVKLYIPVTFTFFAAEKWIVERLDPAGMEGPLAPRVFHLGNLLLHVVNACFVFLLLGRLVGSAAGAFFGAAFFAVHPLMVESVAWVTEAKTQVSAVFSLLALLLFLSSRDARGGGARWLVYLAASASFGLALLSKPNAAAVPLLAATLEFFETGRPRAGRLLLLLPWAAMAVAVYSVMRGEQPADELSYVPPLWARPLIAGDAIAFYLQKTVFPVGLVTDHGRTPANVLQTTWAYFAWLVPAGAILLAAVLPSRRVWLTALALFVFALAPVLGIVPFGYQDISTVADRYAYLALLGPAMAIAYLVARFWSRETAAIAAILLGVLAMMSAYVTASWADDERLFERTLSINPHSYVALNNLSALELRRGDSRRAASYAARVVENCAVPTHLAQGHNHLGNALMMRQEPAQALEHYRKAREVWPEYLIPLQGAGNALAAMGRHEEAAAEYRTLIEAAAGKGIKLAPALTSLGGTYYRLQKFPEAEAAFRRAIDADPKLPQPKNGLASVLAQTGRLDEAIPYFKEAARLAPDFFEPRFYLGVFLSKTGDPEGSLVMLKEAEALQPEHLGVQIHLANLLVELGRPKEAMLHFDRVLEREPRNPEALLGKGRALADLGQPEEAERCLREAIRIDPLRKQASDLLERLATRKSESHPPSNRGTSATYPSKEPAAP